MKWKKKSDAFFGLQFFSILDILKRGVLNYNNIGIKKYTTIFLWVLNFEEVGEILQNFQKRPLGESFWKRFSKVWFWKNFTRDFPVKKIKLKKFFKGFLSEIQAEGKSFQGFPL